MRDLGAIAGAASTLLLGSIGEKVIAAIQR
jgi:hypothetical protein